MSGTLMLVRLMEIKLKELVPIWLQHLFFLYRSVIEQLMRGLHHRLHIAYAVITQIRGLEIDIKAASGNVI